MGTLYDVVYVMTLEPNSAVVGHLCMGLERLVHKARTEYGLDRKALDVVVQYALSVSTI